MLVKSLVALATEKMLLKTSGKTFLRGIDFMYAAGLAPDRLSVMMTTSGKYVLQFHSKCDIRPFAANYPSFTRVLRGIVHVRAWRIKSIEFINVAFDMKDVENLERTIEKLGVELVLLRNCTYPGVRRGDEAIRFLNALNRRKMAVVCEYGDDRLKHRISRRQGSRSRGTGANEPPPAPAGAVNFGNQRIIPVHLPNHPHAIMVVRMPNQAQLRIPGAADPNQPVGEMRRVRADEQDINAAMARAMQQEQDQRRRANMPYQLRRRDRNGFVAAPVVAGPEVVPPAPANDDAAEGEELLRDQLRAALQYRGQPALAPEVLEMWRNAIQGLQQLPPIAYDVQGLDPNDIPPAQFRQVMLAAQQARVARQRAQAAVLRAHEAGAVPEVAMDLENDNVPDNVNEPDVVDMDLDDDTDRPPQFYPVQDEMDEVNGDLIEGADGDW